MYRPNSVPTNSRFVILRILAHDLQVAVRRQVARDILERLAVVARDEDVRMEIVAAMSVDRDVRGRRVEVRRVDARDPERVVARERALRQARDVLADFRERRAAVAAHLQVAVVRARPHDARHHRRLGDGDDRAVRREAVVLRELRCVSRRRPSR